MALEDIKTGRIFLVDMDGVVADFEGGFIKAWQQTYPDRPYIPLEKRKTFRLIDDYPVEVVDDVKGIYCAPGFFEGLEVVGGAVEAIKGLADLDYEVFFCTSPLSAWKNCVGEKHAWIESHFGYEWVKRIILSKDKTIVHGNWLIDDNPQVRGVRAPSWEHVVFDAPYNRDINGKRRLNRWSEWRDVLHFDK